MVQNILSLACHSFVAVPSGMGATFPPNLGRRQMIAHRKGPHMADL